MNLYSKVEIPTTTKDMVAKHTRLTKTNPPTTDRPLIQTTKTRALLTTESQIYSQLNNSRNSLRKPDPNWSVIWACSFSFSALSWQVFSSGLDPGKLLIWLGLLMLTYQHQMELRLFTTQKVLREGFTFENYLTIVSILFLIFELFL